MHQDEQNPDKQINRYQFLHSQTNLAVYRLHTKTETKAKLRTQDIIRILTS